MRIWFHRSIRYPWTYALRVWFPLFCIALPTGDQILSLSPYLSKGLSIRVCLLRVPIVIIWASSSPWQIWMFNFSPYIAPSSVGFLWMNITFPRVKLPFLPNVSTKLGLIRQMTVLGQWEAHHCDAGCRFVNSASFRVYGRCARWGYSVWWRHAFDWRICQL